MQHSTLNKSMKAGEMLLLEASALDAALVRGWVRIKYLRLDGTPRIMMATKNHKLFTYVYKRPYRIKRKNIITVWDRMVGWRSLRRNRILGWAEAGPVGS